MSGPSDSINKQNQIAQEQVDLAQQQNAQAAADKAKMDKLLQPAVSYYTGASTDKSANLAATAPQVGQIAQTEKAAEEQIYASLPAGPARDLALASAKRGEASDVATVRNTAATGAVDKLANIGAGFGSISLQEIGATLSGFSGASSTEQSVMQAEAQKKASTMGLFGQLAGAAGTAIGGRG